jgi:hypothetical protein
MGHPAQFRHRPLERNLAQRAFPDGIYWLTLGQDPGLTRLQETLVHQITGAPTVVKSAVSQRVRAAFGEASSLVTLTGYRRGPQPRSWAPRTRPRPSPTVIRYPRFWIPAPLASNRLSPSCWWRGSRVST